MALRPLQKAFLAAYKETANLTLAARATKIDRRRHYDWISEPEYAEEFGKAHDEAVEVMIGEARRRAVEGTEKPVFYKGDECGAIREYSDNLLMFLIKKERPEYREAFKHEHSGNVSLKFEGSMADLLATYRELTRE